MGKLILRGNCAESRPGIDTPQIGESGDGIIGEGEDKHGPSLIMRGETVEHPFLTILRLKN